eukprot:scaffold2628_cov113-Isochrysis_galbana.AAC.8
MEDAGRKKNIKSKQCTMLVLWTHFHWRPLPDSRAPGHQGAVGWSHDSAVQAFNVPRTETMPLGARPCRSRLW